MTKRIKKKEKSSSSTSSAVSAAGTRSRATFQAFPPFLFRAPQQRGIRVFIIGPGHDPDYRKSGPLNFLSFEKRGIPARTSLQRLGTRAQLLASLSSALPSAFYARTVVPSGSVTTSAVLEAGFLAMGGAILCRMSRGEFFFEGVEKKRKKEKVFFTSLFSS